MDFDLASEKTLTITLATDPAAWDYCADRLAPEMFGSDQARAVFEAVRDVIRSAKPITPVTVGAALAASGKGPSAVPAWAGVAKVSPAEAVALADRVRELWRRRVIAGAAAEVAQRAPDAPSVETAAALAETLTRIEGGGDSGAKRIDRLFLEWMGELERQGSDPTARITYATGFGKFDANMGGLRTGELAVFAARPGNGKSSWGMSLAVNLAASGVPVGLFWLEDDWRDAVRRFLGRRFGAEAWRLRGTPALAMNHAAAFPDVVNRSDLPLFVDDAHGLTITDIAARMRRMSREHGVKVFLLDHLGEVRIEREERWGDRHDLALGRIARIYRDTAKDLGAVPVLIAQMNRRVEQREDPTPRMSDLDGSGQVEQAARMIAFVRIEKSEVDGKPTGAGSLDVVKNSGGQVGRISLGWHPQAMTWREA